MSVEDLVSPAVVAELKDADLAVRRRAGKEASALVRGPRDHVHGGSVQGEIEHLSPGTAADGRRRALVLLTPDEHLSIVGRRGQNGSEFGVGLDS